MTPAGCLRLTSFTPGPSSGSTFVPEVRAQYGSPARWDLRGGQPESDTDEGLSLPRPNHLLFKALCALSDPTGALFCALPLSGTRCVSPHRWWGQFLIERTAEPCAGGTLAGDGGGTSLFVSIVVTSDPKGQTPLD